MDYKEALDYIKSTEKYGSKLRLETINTLLKEMDSPHEDLNYIHIAGTNGKGSISSYTANILKEAGYKVGLFTSPYLERFNERIQINSKDIPSDVLGSLTSQVKDGANKMVEEGFQHPTTFEIITAIAFLYFRKEKAEYVVLEVGLGGRYDATNIIDTSLASIITTIDYDHINVLGNSLKKIAYEKAGIIKENGLVISYPQKKEALEELKDIS